MSADKTKRFVFGKLNWLFLALALVVIAIGYVVVNYNQNIGAVLLVIGYVVLIPLSLLVKSGIVRKNTTRDE